MINHCKEGKVIIMSIKIEYDKNGNLIYLKDVFGGEVWREYDDNGKLIYLKNSEGLEEWYDDNGNRIANINL